MGALYLVLFILATGLQLTVAVYYCQGGMCGYYDNTTNYTICTNDTKNLETITFPAYTTNRQQIVFSINDERNRIACGYETGAGGNLPKASEMVYAQWDGTAAAQAVSSAQLCSHVISTNSPCNATTDKQLVYYEVQPLLYNIPILIGNAFSYWRASCSSLDPANVANYAPNYATDDCARLSIGRGQRFACAASVKQINSDLYVGLLIVCSFVDCFVPNCPLYTQATIPASDCSKISRSLFKCLCAVGEQYNYNVCPNP